MKNSPIIFAAGSKGGVGKSLICCSIIDYIDDLNKKFIFVETDTSNPDVAKAYQSSVQTKVINMDTSDGWLLFIDTCDSNPDSIIIVNTAARSNTGVDKFGANLNNSLCELNREMITFWAINRSRDSIDLLLDFSDQFTNAKITVLRNEIFGEKDKFELFNTTPQCKNMDAREFPALADRVVDAMNKNRYTIQTALVELSIANRAELRRWKLAVKNIFDKIIK